MDIHRIILSANTVFMWRNFCEDDKTSFMTWFTSRSVNPDQILIQSKATGDDHIADSNSFRHACSATRKRGIGLTNISEWNNFLSLSGLGFSVVNNRKVRNSCFMPDVYEVLNFQWYLKTKCSRHDHEGSLLTKTLNRSKIIFETTRITILHLQINLRW